MDISEVLDSMQEMLDQMDEIGNAYPDNADIQRRVGKATKAGAEGMKRLALMLFYKDGEEVIANGSTAISGNGTGPRDGD